MQNHIKDIQQQLNLAKINISIIEKIIDVLNISYDNEIKNNIANDKVNDGRCENLTRSTHNIEQQDKAKSIIRNEINDENNNKQHDIVQDVKPEDNYEIKFNDSPENKEISSNKFNFIQKNIKNTQLKVFENKQVKYNLNDIKVKVKKRLLNQNCDINVQLSNLSDLDQDPKQNLCISHNKNFNSQVFKKSTNGKQIQEQIKKFNTWVEQNKQIIKHVQYKYYQILGINTAILKNLIKKLRL